MKVQVLVVSEIRFFREGLANALGGEYGFGVRQAVAPGEAARSIGLQAPDVVLLHVSVPDGPQLARTVTALAPRAATIALAVAEDEGSIVSWAEAGVAGYVPPDSSLAQVAEAVRLVANGGAACSPQVAAVLLRRVARLAPSRATTCLTARETEVARLVQSGLSNKEISRRLTISLPTVKNHVHHILDKLQVDRRSLITLGPDP
jgi:two-component system, NarL family, nitrate/nitrite response regulator NarL